MQNFIDDMLALEESVKKAKVKPLGPCLAESAALVTKIQTQHLSKVKDKDLHDEIQGPLELIKRSIHDFEEHKIDTEKLKKALSQALHTEDVHLATDLEMVIVALEQLR